MMDAYPYLQVWNSAEELVGLLRGPFPLAWLHRGVVSFAVSEPYTATIVDDSSAPVFRRVDLQTCQYAKRTAQGIKVWWAVRTDLSIEALRAIRAFR
jgi:hypothetical protein